MIYNPDENSEEFQYKKSLMLKNAKIYHFVGAKPWKKLDKGNSFNLLWWKYKEEVIQEFKQSEKLK